MQLLSQVVDHEYLRRPDVFRRDALYLTFQMLRSTHPDLALLVQNLLQGIPLQEGDDEDATAVQVRLPFRDVRAIRIALSEVNGLLHRGAGNAAPDFARQWIITAALVNDWRALETADRGD